MWRFDGRILAACLSVCLPSFAFLPMALWILSYLSSLSLPFAIIDSLLVCCFAHLIPLLIPPFGPGQLVRTAPNGQRNAQLTPFTASHF